MDYATELTQRLRMDNDLLNVEGSATFVAAEDAGSAVKLKTEAPYSIQRCRNSSKRYGIYRTYLHDEDTMAFQGPLDPTIERISDAFCMTNATGHLTFPWLEAMTSNRYVRLQSSLTSHAQDIAVLAFDEMNRYHSWKAALELIVNITSGSPSEWDIDNIKQLSIDRQLPVSERTSLDPQDKFREKHPSHGPREDKARADYAFEDVRDQNSGHTSIEDGVAESDAGSKSGRQPGVSARTASPDSSTQRHDTKHLFWNPRFPYIEPGVFWFGPEFALPGTVLGELESFDQVKRYTDAYLKLPEIEKEVERLALMLASSWGDDSITLQGQRSSRSSTRQWGIHGEACRE